MDDFYAARSENIPPLPWTNFAPPLSVLRTAPTSSPEFYCSWLQSTGVMLFDPDGMAMLTNGLEQLTGNDCPPTSAIMTVVNGGLKFVTGIRLSAFASLNLRMRALTTSVVKSLTSSMKGSSRKKAMGLSL